MSPGWSAWFLGGLCAVVTLAGASLTLAALFWDRSRGRRRCRSCWYDMSSVVGLRCPECGREARRERDLFRTRRRWRRAAVGVALLVLVAPAGFAVPRVRARGWVGAVPTTVLMAVSPWGPAQASTGSWGQVTAVTLPDRMVEELTERLRRREVWSLQAALFGRFWARRAAAYDPLTERPGPTHARRWLGLMVNTGEAGDWSLRPYRDAVLPKLVSFRTRWAADRTFFIRNDLDLIAVSGANLSYTLRIDGVVPKPTMGSYWGDRAIPVGPLSVGVHEVEVEMRLTEADLASHPAASVLWSHRRTERVEIVGRTADVPGHGGDAEIDALVRRAVRLEAVRTGDAVDVTVWFLLDPFPGEPPDAIAQSPIPDMHFRLGVIGGLAPIVDWPVNETDLLAKGAAIVTDAEGRWTVGLRADGPVVEFVGKDVWFTVYADTSPSPPRRGGAWEWDGRLRYRLKGALGRITLPAPE